jgi:hypothetical protein
VSLGTEVGQRHLRDERCFMAGADLCCRSICRVDEQATLPPVVEIGAHVADRRLWRRCAGCTAGGRMRVAAPLDARTPPGVVACSALGYGLQRGDAHRFVDLTARVARELGRTLPLPAPLRDLAASRARSVLARACRRVPTA